MLKTFLEDIAVVLCKIWLKKTARKNSLYWKKGEHFENWQKREKYSMRVGDHSSSCRWKLFIRVVFEYEDWFDATCARLCIECNAEFRWRRTTTFAISDYSNPHVSDEIDLFLAHNVRQQTGETRGEVSGDLKDFATQFPTKKTTSSPIAEDLLKNIEALINNKFSKETDQRRNIRDQKTLSCL